MGEAGKVEGLHSGGALWYHSYLFPRKTAFWLTAAEADKRITKDQGIMPKIKTKKSATKKFKMSATGKAMRTQAGKRHLNGYKSRGRKRNLRGSTAVYEGNQKMVARMLQA